MKGSRIAGPVPQTMWKRGTELPWPIAPYPPRSVHPTTGKNFTPLHLSQSRFSWVAKAR